jgi:hypothetical protein
MSEVEFFYQGATINIQCKPEEKMGEIIKRFNVKTGTKIEDLYFIYNGGILNQALTFKEQINENEKQKNKISILVDKKLDSTSYDDESYKRSKYIICPKCKESAFILIDNFKIKFFDCKNGHKIDNINYDTFEQSQNYDESKIKC